MNIEQANVLMTEVQNVFGEAYCIEVRETKGTPKSWFWVSVSRIEPFCCVFTMNSPQDWPAFQEAARIFVASEQEEWEEAKLEEQAEKEIGHTEIGYYDDEKEEWVKVPVEINLSDPDYPSLDQEEEVSGNSGFEIAEERFNSPEYDPLYHGEADMNGTSIDFHPAFEIDPFKQQEILNEHDSEGPDLNETVHPVVEEKPSIDSPEYDYPWYPGNHHVRQQGETMEMKARFDAMWQ